MGIKTKNRQAGFSLIEIVVSLFLVLVLFQLVILQINALLIAHRQRNEVIAYHVANKQMEELRTMPFAQLPGSGTIEDALLDQIPSASGNFTVTNHGTYSGVKEFVVTVNWNDGTSRQIIVRTLAGR